MPNKYVNKVVIGKETKLDLTADTVTPDKLAKGITAHDKSGAPITGTSTKDADTSDATAAVAEVLNGKTFYARGAKMTGTMPPACRSLAIAPPQAARIPAMQQRLRMTLPKTRRRMYRAQKSLVQLIHTPREKRAIGHAGK